MARPAGLEPATLGLEGCGPVSDAACSSTDCENCHADVPRDWMLPAGAKVRNRWQLSGQFTL